MAYEFKKLSDVDVIESVSETTNVLVEENGEIVKTELETAVRTFELPYIQFTRLQDTLTISISNDSHRNIETTELMELMEKYSLPYSHFEFYDMGETYDPMAPHPTYNCKEVLNNVVNFGGNMYGARTFTFNFGDEVPHIIFDALANTITLDPDWVAPAESIPAPATAEVGQVIAVKAVDENGKPTEWEAVDAGGGSGGGAMVISRLNNVLSCNIPFENLRTSIINGAPCIYVVEMDGALSSYSTVSLQYSESDDIWFVNVYSANGNYITGFEYSKDGLIESVDG